MTTRGPIVIDWMSVNRAHPLADVAATYLLFRVIETPATLGRLTRGLFEILRNPNIRILIASNTQLQAEVFLREIKFHLALNEKLIATVFLTARRKMLLSKRVRKCSSPTQGLASMPRKML